MSATSNRAHYRKIANRCRRIPGEHGLRPWHVYASVGSWSGAGHPGEGTRTDAEVELLESGQPPKVRQVKPEAVALGTGLESGDMVVGPVTPVVGSAWATLLGDAATANESFRLRLTHEETGDDLECVIISTARDRALRALVTVRPVRAGS